MDRNLRLLALGTGVRLFGNALYFPFLAIFLYSTLGIGYVEIALIVVLVGTVQIPFGLAGGLLTDRIGRRPLILLGLGGEAAATAALGYGFLLPSLPIAVLAATLGGALSTISGPAYSAYTADFASGSERTVAFTWYRIGFNAGYSAGVALGGVLVGFLGFAGAVEVGAAIVGAATLLLYVELDPSAFDRDRAARTAAASPGAAAVRRPAGRSMRASLAVLARDRVAMEVALGFTLVTLLAAQWAVIFPLFVHNILGIGYGILGVGLALNGLLVVVGQRPMTERLLGTRHTTIAIGGVALYAAAYLSLGAAGRFGLVPVAAFFVAVVVLTIGENLITIPGATLPSNLAPAEEVGSYNGAFQTMGGIGFQVATLLGGLVLAIGSDPLWIWVVLTLPAIPAILLLRDAGHRIPPEANRA